MQIQESDLTTESAQGAVLSLRALAREPDPSYEAELAMLNRLQILQGYTLRQKALEDRSAFGVESSQALESQRLFCSWLDTGAFWYD